MAGETSNNSDAGLAKRHKQSAIIGRLTVACLVAMRSGYARKHIGAVLEELLVGLAIRIADDLGSPLTASDLSKHLGLPRSNVRRCLDALITEGVIRKECEHGYRGELNWLASRIDAAATVPAAEVPKLVAVAPLHIPPSEALSRSGCSRSPSYQYFIRSLSRSDLAAFPGITFRPSSSMSH